MGLEMVGIVSLREITCSRSALALVQVLLKPRQFVHSCFTCPSFSRDNVPFVRSLSSNVAYPPIALESDLWSLQSLL